MILDWKKYEDLARQTVSEGIVLLKNEGHILPLSEGCRLSVFGRMQNNYYKSGTGSGGMVNVPVVRSIIDVLKDEKIILNRVYISYMYAVGYNRSCGGASSRAYRDVMLS